MSADYPALDAAVLGRERLFAPGRYRWSWPEGGGVILEFEVHPLVDLLAIASPGHHSEIRVTSTAQHFGGERRWFICPAGCERRVGKLYLVGSGWRCRHCAGLRYESQSQRAPRRRRACEAFAGAPRWSAGARNSDSKATPR